MKTILIVTALSQEGKTVKSELKKYNKKHIKLLFLSTGMGNYKMILELTKFLQEHTHIDFLVNVWVCGKKTSQSSLTSLPVAQKEEFLNIARIVNIHTKKELIVPQLLGYDRLQSIASSEQVVYDPSILEEEKFVDMESYGFELVAESFRIPRAILKVPVDEVWEETKNFDYNIALQKLATYIDYEDLLERIEIYFEKNKKINPDFEKYFENWKLTFSEKEQMKKLYFSYETLTKQQFETYFLAHKHEQKKVFFEQLRTHLQTYIIT